jgi:hypothetical protein
MGLSLGLRNWDSFTSSQANALCRADWQKRGKGYDPTEHARFVDELIALFAQL